MMTTALETEIGRHWRYMQRARREGNQDWAARCRTVLWVLFDLRREGRCQ